MVGCWATAALRWAPSPRAIPKARTTSSPAQSGPSNAYTASNYNAGTTGGSFADWLITPSFSTRYAGTASFWVRADILPDYTDHFSYGLSAGGTSTADFPLTRASIVPGAWTQYTLSFVGTGQDTYGRLAIVHVGSKPKDLTLPLLKDLGW